MFFKIGTFRNFSIFTGKHLCWSLLLIKLRALRPSTLFKRDFNTGVYLWILRNFYESFFDRKPSVASVDLLFSIKSNVGWFLLKRVDLVIVRVIYTLLVETIPTRFYWLTCRNQKRVQSKPLKQRLSVLILGFFQCRQVLCKLTRGYIYQVAPGEPSFASTCSKKE